MKEKKFSDSFLDNKQKNENQKFISKQLSSETFTNCEKKNWSDYFFENKQIILDTKKRKFCSDPDFVEKKFRPTICLHRVFCFGRNSGQGRTWQLEIVSYRAVVVAPVQW